MSGWRHKQEAVPGVRALQGLQLVMVCSMCKCRAACDLHCERAWLCLVLLLRLVECLGRLRGYSTLDTIDCSLMGRCRVCGALGGKSRACGLRPGRLLSEWYYCAVVSY